MTHTQHELPPMSDERNKMNGFGHMRSARQYGIFGFYFVCSVLHKQISFFFVSFTTIQIHNFICPVDFV